MINEARLQQEPVGCLWGMERKPVCLREISQRAWGGIHQISKESKSPEVALTQEAMINPSVWTEDS